MRRMYSKKELKETIESAIESGEIPSGTKLYKHYILFQSGDEVILISSTSNQYKVNSEIYDRDIISSLVMSENNGDGVFIFYDQNGLTYFDFDDGKKITISKSDLSSFTDTVTEL